MGSPGGFVGFDNFREIPGNEVFRQTVLNSFVFTSIALTAMLAYWILRSANWIEKRLGHTGMNVIERVMGLILAATAVQFVVDGIQTSLPALGK